jgi:hypothetical protein
VSSTVNGRVFVVITFLLVKLQKKKKINKKKKKIKKKKEKNK